MGCIFVLNKRILIIPPIIILLGSFIEYESFARKIKADSIRPITVVSFPRIAAFNTLASLNLIM
jgi:hypothetical protein